MFALPRLCVFVLASLASLPAWAATFLVDTSSNDPAQQICDADISNADCSLRGAILLANTSAGPHTIAFALPVSDPGYRPATEHWRIEVPQSALGSLPSIRREQVTIDGTTQPGSVANSLTTEEGGSNAILKIELYGSGVVFPALTAGPGSSEMIVRGLIIGNFSAAVQINSGSGHAVEGNFLGTDVTGSNAQNNITGVTARAPTRIGGTTAAARNLISGNSFAGVWLLFESNNGGGSGSLVQGNLIGTDASGTLRLPGNNQFYGVRIQGGISAAVIGGDAITARNLIAGNDQHAVFASNDTSDFSGAPTRVIGNWFGTDVSGQFSIPNGTRPGIPELREPTIRLAGSDAPCGVEIGGNALGEANLIANGPAAGVHVSRCTGGAIRPNRFRGNALAIDLSPGFDVDGATANDPDDADSGGNRLQNSPQLLAQHVVGDDIELRYRVDSSVANASYPLRIDLYRSTPTEGQVWIGGDAYTAADAGLAKTTTVPALLLQGGTVAMTATDAGGNTSELALSNDVFADGFE